MKLRGITSVAALIVCGSLHAAQEGALKVLVLKPDKTPLIGATIRANVAVSSPTQINSAIVTRTDERGVASFWKLSPGVFTIQVEVEGYLAGAIRTDVAADRVSHLQILLRPLPAVEVEVEDTFDALDPTSATTGLTVKTEMIETIPTSVHKRIQDLGQMVPGVILSPMPALAGGSMGRLGDPALVVTLNRDGWGRSGFSSNNYLLDGIDVSNPLYGRGSVNIMQDLLAEVEIKTGGVSAEHQAKNGIFFNATTINGGNEFHGGFISEFAPSSLKASAKPGRPDIGESFVSNGFFSSGPLIQNTLWYVVGASKSKAFGTLDTAPNVAITPGEKRNFRVNDELNLFAKLTWQVNPANRLIAEYHSNDNTSDNGDDSTIVTNWVQTTKAGGDRGLLWYSYQSPKFILDLKAGQDFQRLDYMDPANAPDYTLLLCSLTPLAPNESQLGASGAKGLQRTRRTTYRADALMPFTTGPLSHTLKFGLEYSDSKRMLDGARKPYSQNMVQPVTFSDMVSTGATYLSYFMPMVLNSINADPAYASIKQRLSSTGGDVSFADLGAYTFDEVDPNHPNTHLAYRTQAVLGSNASRYSSATSGFYLQDYMTWNRLTFSPGIRFDRYSLKSDTGVTVYRTKDMVAPRVSLSADVFGDAKAKAFIYFGRYFNPIQGINVSTLTATKSTGSIMEARIMGQWVNFYNFPTEQPTYMQVIADGTKMPYTNEWRYGYEQIVNIGKAVNTFSVIGTYRKDGDIIQAVDPLTYADADYLEYVGTSYFKSTDPRIVSTFRNLAIPLASFAGGGQSSAPTSLMNVPGAFRRYKALDLAWKAETSRSLFMASYTWVRAEGTSLEIGDMTPVASVPQLDPRLPWMRGPLDGSYNWVAKIHGSHRFANGFTLGLSAKGDSGFHYTPALASTTYMLLANIPTTWEDALNFKVGEKMTPKRFTMDVHLNQDFSLRKGVRLSLAGNIFNVLNNQKGIVLAEGMNVRPGVNPDQPYLFVPPTSVSFTAKLRF